MKILKMEKIHLSISVITQLLNYIFPLIILIYISHSINKSELSLYLFTQSFIQIFISLTDYGFVISGTKYFSTHFNNKKKLSEYYYHAMAIKFLLFLLSILILYGIGNISSYVNENFYFILFYFGVVLGNSIFPGWAFIGLKEYKYIYLNTIIIYFITIVLIFNMNIQNDIIYIPLIFSISYLIPALLGFIILSKKLSFNGIRFRTMTTILKSNKLIFFSNSIYGYYQNLPMILLGLKTNQIVLHNFSLPDKLIKVSISLFNFILRLTIPYSNSLKYQSKIIKNIYILSALSFFFILLLILMQKYIILYIFNTDKFDVYMYNTLMASLFFKIIYTFLINHYYYISNKEIYVLKVISISFSLFTMAYFISNINVSIILLFSDFLIFLFLILKVKNDS